MPQKARAYTFPFMIEGIRKLPDGCTVIRLSYRRRNRIAGYILPPMEYEVKPGDTFTCEFSQAHVQIGRGMLRWRINNGPWVPVNSFDDHLHEPGPVIESQLQTKH